MKYLFINASLTDGGSERVMTLLANEFAESGIDTSMLLLREKEKATYTVSKKLNCVQLKYGTKNKFLIMLKRIFLLRKHVRETNPDVIISFMWDINIFTLLACLGFHKKMIISERAFPMSEMNSLTKKVWREFGQRYIYSLADKIVLQTNQVKQYYRKKIQEKCVVIPNPINDSLPSVFEGLREKSIVAAGRLTKQKNFPMLIKAFALFHAVYPEYILYIFGEGELRKPLEELIIDMNLSECVKLPGYITDINEKMRKATMYVSSSDFEGISNAMLEALAMGVPTVCTDCPVGGASMVIDDHVNGILVPVGDEQALFEGMREMIDNPEQANKFSMESVKVKDKLSIDKITQEWLSI